MRSLLIASTLLLSLNSYAFNDFEKALTSYNKNEVDEAYVHLKNVLKNDEDNLPAIVLMGRVLLQKGLYLEGIEVLQEALFRGADINFLVNDLSNALMLTNSYDEVIKLSSDKNLTPASQLTTFLLSGNAYSAMKDFDNAKVYYKKAYALAPNDLRTISALAAHELNQNNYSDADNLIAKAQILFPNDSRVWNLKGQLHDKRSEFDLALKAYKQGYEVNPDDPFIQRALANAYANANNTEEALSLIDNILKETPDDPFAKLLKSRLFAYSSREEEASQILVDISQKLSLLSDKQKNSNASLSLVAGTSAYLQNNLELAQKELQFYVQEQPQDLSGISLLVDIYLRQGQSSKAFELLESKNKIIQYNLSLSIKLFELYLNDNKIYKAEQILSPLEKSYGKHLPFILAKVNLLAKSNQLSKAIELLNKNKPKDFSSAYFLTKGLLFASNNQMSEAHKVADELLKTNIKNVDYLSFKASLLLKNNRWTEALNFLNQILELQPNNFNALFNSATANAALSKFEDAKKISVQLLEAQPDNLSLKVLNAKIDRDMGNIDQAKEVLTQIIDKNSTYIPALETLMELNYQQKEYKEALEQADRLSKLSFLNAKYIKMKAQIYLGLDDFTNAKKQLQLLSGVVTTPRDIFIMSQMQIQANDISGAKKSLEKALSIEPDNIFIQRSLVKLEIDLGDFSEADTILTALEKKRKLDPNILMLRGDYYLKKGNKVTAQKLYLKALNQDNNFHRVLLKLYQLALDKVEEPSFTATLQNILSKKPNNYLMRTVYADYLLSNGNAQEAKVHYEKLITVDNLINKASILNNLANIYITIDLNKAELYSKQSMELDNNSSAIIDTYGWILSLNSKFDESLSILRKAYSMDSNNPSINYHIGYTLVKLNRIEEAKQELKQSLANKNRFTERKDAQKLLNSL
ncbi:tetratricopeptide repeat protein [Colwellia sp. UCD-KL20]|uniref:tetratricopeptide repeat protein n=1 Tax=Colwellia sp. UCD-KL20 TaxID=1917165 RepID=UPI0009714003|nr:tetratricopeptide repeat protein [Colwellia sp. UCD-KL20]